MGDKVYILTRHLLYSQTMDPKKQINKPNQDVHVWRMNDVYNKTPPVATLYL